MVAGDGGCHPLWRSGREFGGVSIDTRTLGADELFIGIHGEQFDGADFAIAIARGAAGVVCQSDGDGKVRRPW
jgi:UDP-N-acetylmuramoyl-tripeptide--D-alanyl-D-alanine ligase